MVLKVASFVPVTDFDVVIGSVSLSDGSVLSSVFCVLCSVGSKGPRGGLREFPEDGFGGASVDVELVVSRF